MRDVVFHNSSITCTLLDNKFANIITKHGLVFRYETSFPEFIERRRRNCCNNRVLPRQHMFFHSSLIIWVVWKVDRCLWINFPLGWHENSAIILVIRLGFKPLNCSFEPLNRTLNMSYVVDKSKKAAFVWNGRFGDDHVCIIMLNVSRLLDPTVNWTI